jgi:hypothetical protein
LGANQIANGDGFKPDETDSSDEDSVDSDSDGTDGGLHEMQAPSGGHFNGVQGTPAVVQRLQRLSLAKYTEATTEGFAGKLKHHLKRKKGRNRISGDGCSLTFTDGIFEVAATRVASHVLKLHMLGVDGQLFKDEFVKELMEYIDSELFAAEKDLDLGSKGRSFLMQSTLDAAIFTMYKGKKVMKAAPMSPVLRKLLNWVRELCRIQNKMIERYIRRKGLKGKVDFKRFVPNLVQAVVLQADKNYTTRHDDTGPETCVGSLMCMDHMQDITTGHPETILPFDYEQQVVMAIFTCAAWFVRAGGCCKAPVLKSIYAKL